MGDAYDEQARVIADQRWLDTFEKSALAKDIAAALRAAADGARRETVDACRQQIKATADSYPRAKRMLNPDDPSDAAQMTPLFQVAYILDREHERMAVLLPATPQPDPVSAAREAVVRAVMAVHRAKTENHGSAPLKLTVCLIDACAALAALESKP